MTQGIGVRSAGGWPLSVRRTCTVMMLEPFVPTWAMCGGLAVTVTEKVSHRDRADRSGRAPARAGSVGESDWCNPREQEPEDEPR